MRSRQKNKGKVRVSKEGVNFVVTLVTLSMLFIFVGYLLGQYAVQILQAQHTAQVQVVQEVEPAAPVLAPPPPPTTEPVPLPSQASQPSRGSSGSDSLYRVQVGAFAEKANADRLVAELREHGYVAIVSAGPPYRVQTGAFSARDNAVRLSEELKSLGFEVAVLE